MNTTARTHLVNRPPEVWKQIYGLESLFSVSNHGCVKSDVDRTMKIRWSRGRHGRLRVHLLGRTGMKVRYVDVLVADAFMPPQPMEHDLKHVDGNPEESNVWNLCWRPRIYHNAHSLPPEGLVEMWKLVSECDGLCSVSNYGNVRSEPDLKTLQGLVGVGGRMYLRLCGQRKTYHQYIDVLVAKFFLPSKPANSFLKHVDGFTWNCGAWNLCWEPHVQQSSSKKEKSTGPSLVRRHVNKPVEVWRSVWGCKGIYSVSNHGRMRLDVDGSMLKQYQGPGGRKQVRLRYRGNPTLRFIDIIVAETFLPPKPDGHEVKHVDGLPFDNGIWNLFWKRRTYWNEHK